MVHLLDRGMSFRSETKLVLAYVEQNPQCPQVFPWGFFEDDEILFRRLAFFAMFYDY